MSRERIRIRFTKTGDLRWISHRDLARVWERLLRRAGLELAFSEGFHPKPKISFPSALALGIEALDEIVEMDLVGPIDMTSVESRIAEQLPQGMELLSLEPILPGTPKVVVLSMSYELPLASADAERAAGRAAELQSSGKLTVDREGKTIEAAFSDKRFTISCENDVLRFTLPLASHGSLRPIEVLEALGVADVLTEGTILKRTQVTLGRADSDAVNAGAEEPAAAALIEQEDQNI
ncbi:MAG: TIGR03936 family radical SAM-associated protein [Pirellulales bacterium]